jgi:hypothetical protein
MIGAAREERLPVATVAEAEALNARAALAVTAIRFKED